MTSKNKTRELSAVTGQGTFLHEAALDALEQSDLKLAHLDDIALDEVHTADQVNSDWLGKVIGRNVDGAVLESAKLDGGHDGMTDRRCWKLEWNKVGARVGLPASVFIKATPSQSYLRETLSLLHMAEHEVRFYDLLQPELTGIAPTGYFGAYYPGGRFILVIEDLEASGAKPLWQHDDCSLAHARAVMTALAELHAKYWKTERFNTDLVWLRPRLQKFGRKWHRGSYLEARRRYLEMDIGLELPDDIRELVSLWSAHDEAVYAYWATLDQTVLHGDSHLGNTYSQADGTAGLFDWQVMFRGHGLRDVAYFLQAALTNTMRQQNESDLLGHYFDQLDARGVKLNREKGRRDYALFLMDQFDAHMKGRAFGGYGHQPEAALRTQQTIIGGLRDHDVASLIRHVSNSGAI